MNRVAHWDAHRNESEGRGPDDGEKVGGRVQTYQHTGPLSSGRRCRDGTNSSSYFNILLWSLYCHWPVVISTSIWSVHYCYYYYYYYYYYHHHHHRQFCTRSRKYCELVVRTNKWIIWDVLSHCYTIRTLNMTEQVFWWHKIRKPTSIICNRYAFLRTGSKCFILFIVLINK